MPSHVEIDDNWRENVGAAIEGFFETRLGPDIAGDARRYCPERTGDLRESIEHHIEGGNLIVSATGSDERWYAAYVELGTRAHRITAKPGGALYWPGARHPVKSVEHPATAARPFLRPAAYTERGE